MKLVSPLGQGCHMFEIKYTFCNKLQGLKTKK